MIDVTTHIQFGPSQPQKGATGTAQKHMLEVTIYKYLFVYIQPNHKLSHQCGPRGFSLLTID